MEWTQSAYWSTLDVPDGRVKCHYGLSCPSCRETERGDVVEVELDEPAWQQEKTIFETRRHEWRQSQREGGRGRERTEGARGVCGGMVLFGRLVDNTSPTSSPCNSSSPPLPLLPHHPIRSMATDKQARIFDETGTLTYGQPQKKVHVPITDTYTPWSF